MSVKDWRVEDGKFLHDNMAMTASCHHRNQGACGGCYMRLSVALDELEKLVDDLPMDAPDRQKLVNLIDDVHEARRAEKKT